LLIQEIKKNIGFFVIMTLVLSLLLSAGVSLFNFSFEINREIINSFDNEFAFGHSVLVDGFHQNTDEWRANGVFYASYGGSSKAVEGIDDFWLSINVFHFEDYLPPIMQITSDRHDDFLVDGRFFTSADNRDFDGRFPIFISDAMIKMAKVAGLDISVGDELNLYWKRYIFGEEDNAIIIDGTEEYVIIKRTFFVEGIYRLTDTAYFNRLPFAIISVAAHKEFLEEMGENIGFTDFIITNLEDLRRFEREANRRGLQFSSWVLDDIALLTTFSGVFVSVSFVILLLSGAIVFIYAGMIINKRLAFIGILKAMGMTNFKVSKLFFYMLLAAFFIAFLFGNVFSIFISSHFSYLAYSLFEYNLGIGFNLVSQLIFAGAIVVIVFLSSILLYRKIKKISVAKVLTLRE